MMNKKLLTLFIAGAVLLSGYYVFATPISHPVIISTTADLVCTNCIGPTEITDSYVLNTVDSMSSSGAVVLTVTRTDNGNIPVIIIESDAPTPAANDEVALQYRLSDSVGTQTIYGEVDVRAAVVTDGSERGTVGIDALGTGAALVEMATFDGNGPQMVVTINPTNADVDFTIAGDVTSDILRVDATTNTTTINTLALTNDLAIADGGTGASSLADLITMSTDTTGNYVLTVAAGDGISIAEADSEGATKTVVATLGTTIVTGEITDATIDQVDIDDTDTLAGNAAHGDSAVWFGTTGLIFEGSTSNTNEGLLIMADPGADVTITIPAATDTLIGKATTDTLTNKTFDANGTGNSLSNVDVADLANGTDGELITWSATGVAAVVATGSSGDVLTSNGAGTAPTFQAGGGGGEAAFTAESAPGTNPTATGTDAIGIGDTAVAGDAAGDLGVLAIGARSTATGINAVALGENTDATGANSVAIGGHTTDATSADATAANTIAIGVNTLADATEAIAIGDSADAGGVGGIAIGDTTVAGTLSTNQHNIAIGTLSIADTAGDDAIAIGRNADATGANAIAIGGHSVDASSADATASDTIAIGFNALAASSDSLAIGGNAETTGERAVAIGINTDATDINAIALGFGAQATAATTVAIGGNTDATGINCIAIGGNATDTDSADCSAADSLALGQHVLADDIGEFIFGSGEFAAQSDAHTSIFVLRNSTTDATQTEIFADGSAGDISVPSDCTVSFRINVVARQTDADGVSAGYLITGVIDNNAGTTALVGSITTTTVGEDVAGWDVTVTADDTNDGINVLVTGAVGDAVRWVGRAEIVEVCG